MTREERIKVLEHYNNILIVSNYDKTKLRTVKALEQAISDMQILDKIEEKLKEDVKTDYIEQIDDVNKIVKTAIKIEGISRSGYAKEILDIIKEK